MAPRLKFRNGWKYLISEWEAFTLCRRMEPFLAHDSQTNNGVYMIRSLYFDDLWDSCYNEKLMGFEDRCKWRIGCYNCSDSSIKLERKLKRGAIFILFARHSGERVGDEIMRILDRMKVQLKSKTLRDGITEMTQKVLCKNNDTLIQHNGEYHG